MKSIRWFLASLVLVWLGCTYAQGQSTPYKSIYSPPAPIPNGESAGSTASSYAPSGGFSEWITYDRACCNGPHGGRYTPLFTELYMRAGPSIPIGGQTLSRELQTGWSFVGGGRALFFNQPLTSAWVVDLHLINTNESGGALNTRFPITIFQGPSRLDFGTNGVPGVTIKASNRTMVGLGFGREAYLWGTADAQAQSCRLGWDMGGRYGSQRVDLHEARRITDTIGGIYAAIHADVDIPCQWALFHTGVRVEWAYTWSDVLQRTSDVQDINILWTIGSRF